jgi:hypothetical protein
MNQKKAIKLLVRSKILGKLILKPKIKEYVNQKPKKKILCVFKANIPNGKKITLN